MHNKCTLTVTLVMRICTCGVFVCVCVLAGVDRKISRNFRVWTKLTFDAKEDQLKLRKTASNVTIIPIPRTIDPTRMNLKERAFHQCHGTCWSCKVGSLWAEYFRLWHFCPHGTALPQMCGLVSSWPISLLWLVILPKNHTIAAVLVWFGILWLFYAIKISGKKNKVFRTNPWVAAGTCRILWATLCGFSLFSQR